MRTEDDFVALLNDELGLPLTTDDLDQDLDTVDSFDSVHLLALCTVLERETGRSLSLAAVLEAPTLGAVFRLAVAP